MVRRDWADGRVARRVFFLKVSNLVVERDQVREAKDLTGKRLGTLRGPEHPHNMAWGDADGRTLYLAAQAGIYRLRLNVTGAGALPNAAAMAKK